MKYIAQHFKNDKLKQSLLNEIAIRQIKNGINHITELENIYNTYVTDPTLRTAYKQSMTNGTLPLPANFPRTSRPRTLTVKLTP